MMRKKRLIWKRFKGGCMSFRKSGLQYQLTKSFETEAHVEIESFWKINVSHNTAEGVK